MQHYAFSDIHGNYILFKKVLEYMNNNGDWHCYFLGDACDRGADGWKIIKSLLQDTVHFTYLKGNHEDILVKAGKKIYNFIKETSYQLSYATIFADYYIREIRLCVANGGDPTLRAALDDPDFFSIINQLEQLPLTAIYNQYDMCHAGTTMDVWEHRDEKSINGIIVQEELLWSREHFYYPWFPNRILVHGHTPIIHDQHYHCNSAPSYLNGEKINLDAGTAKTNQIRLLNLDTNQLTIIQE